MKVPTTFGRDLRKEEKGREDRRGRTREEKRKESKANCTFPLQKNGIFFMAAIASAGLPEKEREKGADESASGAPVEDAERESDSQKDAQVKESGGRILIDGKCYH